MSGAFDLSHPWLLLLGAVVLLLPILQRRSLADLQPLQRRICLLLRAVILLLLVLALAGLRWLLPGHELAVLFAVDDSASISAPARKEARDFVASSLLHAGAGDSVGIVGFAHDAALWQPPGGKMALAGPWPEPIDRKATAIGRALEFASAIFPSGKTRRLVLLSDGNDTGGHAAETAARLAAAGVQLHTVPLHNAAVPEVLVERVEIPRRLKQGEPFDLVAHVHSNVATEAKVKLYQINSSWNNATSR